MPETKYTYEVKTWSETRDDDEVFYPLGFIASGRPAWTDLLTLACAWTLGVCKVTISYEFHPKTEWPKLYRDYHSSYGQVDRSFDEYMHVIARTKIEPFSMD